MAAIVDADIQFRKSGGNSSGTGGAGAADAVSIGNRVGNAASAFSGGLNSLFDNVSAAENTAGHIDYRVVYFTNTNGANNATNVKVWVTDTAGGATLQLGVDPTAASAIATAAAQAVTVASETTAPNLTGGTAFQTANSSGTAVNLGTVNAGFVKAFWVRREVTAGTTALAGETATFNYSLDTTGN